MQPNEGVFMRRRSRSVSYAKKPTTQDLATLSNQLTSMSLSDDYLIMQENDETYLFSHSVLKLSSNYLRDKPLTFLANLCSFSRYISIFWYNGINKITFKVLLST